MGAELDQKGGGLMKRKIRDSRGETIIEVLAAILVGALSIALLFGAAMVSGNMDRGAQEADESFQESLNAAEKQKVLEGEDGTGPVPNGTVVRIKGEFTVDATPPVTFYGGPDAWAYDLKPEEGVAP